MLPARVSAMKFISDTPEGEVGMGEGGRGRDGGREVGMGGGREGGR